MHTLNPGCAHTAPRPCTQRRVVARAGPYRGPLPGRIAPVSGRVATLSAISRTSCVISQPVSRPCYAILRHKRSPLATIQFLYRDSPLDRPCASVRLSPLRAGRLYRSVVSCTWLAVSQPCCAPQHAPTRSYRCLVPLLCHDTMYCIVTKTGKWAIAHPAASNPFFFLIFFPATVRPQFFFSCLK